jgi:hypothetical protein
LEQNTLEARPTVTELAVQASATGMKHVMGLTAAVLFFFVTDHDVQDGKSPE